MISLEVSKDLKMPLPVSQGGLFIAGPGANKKPFTTNKNVGAISLRSPWSPGLLHKRNPLSPTIHCPLNIGGTTQVPKIFNPVVVANRVYVVNIKPRRALAYVTVGHKVMDSEPLDLTTPPESAPDVTVLFNPALNMPAGAHAHYAPIAGHGVVTAVAIDINIYFHGVLTTIESKSEQAA